MPEVPSFPCCAARPAPWAPYTLLRAALACALTSGCHTGSAQPNHAVRDSAGITIIENQRPSWSPEATWVIQPEADLTIGRTEGDSRYQIDQTGFVLQLPNGRIVIENAIGRVLRVYDASGAWHADLGGPGSGSREFDRIAGLWARGDTVVAYDGNRRRLSWYLSDGPLVRDTPLESGDLFYSYQGTFDDGSFLLSGGGVLRDDLLTRNTATLARFDGQGRFLAPIASIPDMEWYRYSNGESGTLPFTPRAHVATFRTEVTVASGDRAEFRVLAMDGVVLRVVRWPHSPRSSGDFEDALRGALLGTADAPNRKYYEPRLREMPARPLPAMSGLIVDDLGCTWVKEYAPLQDNLWLGSIWSIGSGGSWLVFSSGGDWLGTVQMPARLKPLRIGADHVLGIHFDADDVQTVRRYKLIR